MSASFRLQHQTGTRGSEQHGPPQRQAMGFINLGWCRCRCNVTRALVLGASMARDAQRGPAIGGIEFKEERTSKHRAKRRKRGIGMNKKIHLELGKPN